MEVMLLSPPIQTLRNALSLAANSQVPTTPSNQYSKSTNLSSPRFSSLSSPIAPALRLKFVLPILVQCSREQRLDHCLAAYVESGRPLIEIPQHALSQIDIHATHRSDHGELVREE